MQASAMQPLKRHEKTDRAKWHNPSAVGSLDCGPCQSSIAYVHLDPTSTQEAGCDTPKTHHSAAHIAAQQPPAHYFRDTGRHEQARQITTHTAGFSLNYLSYQQHKCKVATRLSLPEPVSRAVRRLTFRTDTRKKEHTGF